MNLDTSGKAYRWEIKQSYFLFRYVRYSKCTKYWENYVSRTFGSTSRFSCMRVATGSSEATSSSTFPYSFIIDFCSPIPVAPVEFLALA